jgi:fluoroacetyl-CoA thioesterase
MPVEVGAHTSWQRRVDEEMATPVGDTVTLSAEVTAIDGRRVTFRVKAEDSGGVAGEGTHERVLIDLARFLQRVGATQYSS